MDKVIIKDDTVTMTKRTYLAIEKKLLWLECLEQAGVDNWAGIDYAYDLRTEYEEEDE
jgi:hypothetical protein